MITVTGFAKNLASLDNLTICLTETMIQKYFFNRLRLGDQNVDINTELLQYIY
jgi:hypothetical protein